MEGGRARVSETKNVIIDQQHPIILIDSNWTWQL